MSGSQALPRAFAALGIAAALIPSLCMWGFSVDDALISVRYATNLARGVGYRFNALGPSTDGVTPLPWAFVLAPLTAVDPLTTLARAKLLGIVAWSLGGGVLGARVGQILCASRAQTFQRAMVVAGFVVMGLAFPIGAWAASGMETGLVTLLATFAATRLEKPFQLAVAAGMAAAFRPEMVVWALSLTAHASLVGPAVGPQPFGEKGEHRLSSRLCGLAIALVAGLPFALCATTRLMAFGRVAPLSVMAKPSDATHGATYAVAASIVTLMPILVFAPWVLLRTRDLPRARVIVLAFVAHALAVVAAGGDWMPFARLMVPVVPSLLLAFVDLTSAAHPAATLARIVFAAALGVTVAVRSAPGGRHVYFDRSDLIDRARPVLRMRKVVACLDVGWVSASTDARVVDLAGVTDPSIAVLPGGHTSKRVDVGMLLDRGVDTVILYSEQRLVEERLVMSDLFSSRYTLEGRLPVGTRGATYAVYRQQASFE